MISWPDELVLDIARRRSVLFLGAGVSKNASNAQGERPKDWVEFLNHVQELVDDGQVRSAIRVCIEKVDLLMACELARRYLGQPKMTTELLKEFSQKRFMYSPVHKDLVEIDSRIVLTTNFDKLYDNAANAILHGDVVIKSYTDAEIVDIVRRQNRCIFKIHGTIDAPAEVILTRSDYAAARSKHANFYRVIDALFMTHTFVFLGASMRDPDMALLLEDLALRYRGTRPHYVVMSDNSISTPEVAVLEESLNIKTLLYSSINNHKELAASIAALKDSVASARAELLETMNW